MEDKDFLGYFSKLGPPSSAEEIKNSATKILNTLIAIGTVHGRKGSTDLATEKAENALKKKYLTGDLGEKVSADLNYTLKRLVRGLYSDNHQVKQGFFLASVLVLAKFKSQIDFEKYLKHVFSETKASKAMKTSEINNMTLGRMMCMSACVEARVFQSHGSNQINQRTLKVIVGCLTEIYKQADFLQESVSAILGKLLHIVQDNKQVASQAVDIIMEQLVLQKTADSSSQVDFQSSILANANTLSLFLRVKAFYLGLQNDGAQKSEYDDIFKHKFIGDKKSIKLIQGLIQRQTYLYPRLHSFLPLLLNEVD